MPDPTCSQGHTDKSMLTGKVAGCNVCGETYEVSNSFTFGASRREGENTVIDVTDNFGEAKVLIGPKGIAVQ